MNPNIEGPNIEEPDLPWPAGASWGYHGNSGRCFAKDIGLVHQWPMFTKGDFIGCGIEWKEDRIFFTLNGTRLGELTYLLLSKSLIDLQLTHPVCRAKYIYPSTPLIPSAGNDDRECLCAYKFWGGAVSLLIQ